ncbi:hypothetical protein DFH06DRAFT_1189597 [Mycena polygramma]|nr:hypothetical protein DFH06DRAFT_1189597 [Mycena polygramma]
MPPHHSLLFSTEEQLHDRSATGSPALDAHRKGTASMSSGMLLRPSHAYWEDDRTLPSSHTHTSSRRPDYASPYSGYTLPRPPRSPHPQYPDANPNIDLSGLIPMYPSSDSPASGSPEMGRTQLLDLSYTPTPEWPTNNLAQYATYAQRNKPLWAGSGDGQWGNSNSGMFGDYIPSSPYSSTTSSSSSSPHNNTGYFLPSASTSISSASTAATLLGRHASGPGASANGGNPNGAKKECIHCHVTSTPLWRRHPTTQAPLCNACGLYLQQRKTLRPQALIDADLPSPPSSPRIPDEEYTGPMCSHCKTRATSVWRRSKSGEQVCNACGVYQRLRGKERPLSLRRNRIKPRTKHAR